MVDNLIRLFESNALSFDSNGIGSISDATTCIITEERNGVYELEMDYPITGSKYSELTHRRIIVAKPNQYSNPQPFRIYSISKPINGIITVNAAHISYDLSGYTVAPMTASTVTQAFDNMVASSDVSCPFTFWTNKTTVATMSTNVPYSMRAILGGMEGSILDTYRGEYEFDGLTVKLWDSRGTNRGVVIRYGKNLTDLKQEENCSNVYTAVRPYWYKDGDVGGYVELPEKTISVSGTFDYTKIYSLDLSEKFENKPTVSQLRSAARTYISNNNLGIPEVSLDVSFVQLSDSEEYKDISLMEEVRLCDTVTVEFPKLSVSAVAECIKTEFDVLTQRYTKIELGSARSNLSKTISGHNQLISDSASRSYVERTAADASENATAMISGNMGGYVVLHDSNGDGKPDEILIMNTDDITTATKVWRWNKNGLGYSSTGYSGNYGTAITANGQIVADYVATGNLNASLITTGTLNAGVIKSGIISDVAGNSSINLANGVAHLMNLKAISSFDLIETNGDIYAQLSHSRPSQAYLNLVDCAKLEGSTADSTLTLNYTKNNNGKVELYSRPDNTDFPGSGISFRNSTGYDVLDLNTVNAIYCKLSMWTPTSPRRQTVDLSSDYAGSLKLYNSNGSQTLNVDMRADQTNGGVLYLKNTSGTNKVWAIGNTGNITCVSLTQTSSRKVKKNINPMDDAYKILELDAVSFDFKDEDLGSNRRGFIAEDVAEILPNLVSKDDIPSLNYTEMIPYLQSVIKNQEARIRALEEKINKLLEE